MSSEEILGMTSFHANTIDLRQNEYFDRCRTVAEKLPTETIIPIKISEYNIWVSYIKMLPENQVPVGLLTSLQRAIFFCKLNEIQACQGCCEANICGCFNESNPIPWQGLCNILGRLLLVCCLPMLYYIRLTFYYMFEHPEVLARTEAAEVVGLPIWFDYRLLQHLTPTHPLLLTVYSIYFVTGLGLAIVSSFTASSRFQSVIIDTIKDLMELSWTGALEITVKNALWPFTKFGIFGICIGVFYWPIVMPICIVASIFHCVPVIYVSFRLIAHALEVSVKEDQSNKTKLPGELKKKLSGLQAVEADQLLSNVAGSKSKE